MQEWIKRGVITGIEGGIYEAKTRRIKEGVTFTLFGKAYLRGELMADGKVADTNYVWPADWFASNYFHRYFRPVDLAFHRRLQRPIAKTLYPILETGWYAAGGAVYAKTYVDLCALLFIPNHKQLSLAKQQLDPSHEELKREGFLDVWEYPLDQRRKWTGVIRWWPGRKWFDDQEARKGPRDLPGRSDKNNLLLPLPEEITIQETSSTTDIPETDSFTPGFRVRRDTDRVREFYAQQGHTRVSRLKAEKEAKILVQLEQEGFSESDINTGLVWLLRNREKFGGYIHSLKLLPNTIGQALKDEPKAPTKSQKVQLQEGTPPQQGGEQMLANYEEQFQRLSPSEQEQLHQIAVENLIRDGYKPDLVRELKSLVKNEIYCLLKDWNAV